MEKNQSKQAEKLFYVIIFIYFIFASHAFGYIGWSLLMPQNVAYLLSFLLLAIFVYYSFTIKAQEPRIKRIVNYIYYLPIIAIFSKLFLDDGQTFNIEVRYTLTPIASFAFFYLLLKYKIKPEVVINSLVIIGLVTFVIQIVQQLKPEYALFRDIYKGEVDDIQVLLRNDLYRFNVGTWAVALFCFYYFWSKLVLDKLSIINIFLFFLFAASIYLYLTRQIIIAVSATLIISLFIHKNSKNTRNIFVAFALISLVIVFNFESLFGYFIDLTKNSEQSQNLRIEFIPEILASSMRNPLMFLFGHGGFNTMESVWSYQGWSVSDVGFFGALWQYGLFYIIVYYYTIYLLVIKYGNRIPLTARLYIISTSINSMFIFPYRDASEDLIWAFILYFCIYGINSKRHVVNNGMLLSEERSRSIDNQLFKRTNI